MGTFDPSIFTKEAIASDTELLNQQLITLLTPMPEWCKKPIRHGDGDPDAIRRCFALSGNFSTVPTGLTRYLASHGTSAIEIQDDLLYGDPVLLQ